MQFLFEKVLASSLLFNTIAKWHENILIIQRSLKFALKIRTMLYNKLLSRWNEAEDFIFLKKKRKSIKKLQRSKSKKRKFDKGNSSIPEDIKKHYLLQLVKSLLFEYIENMKKYKALCKQIDEENKKKVFEIEVMHEKKLEFPNKPRGVNLISSITEENLVELIQNAERERTKWSHILSQINNKIHLSYKSSHRPLGI